MSSKVTAVSHTEVHRRHTGDDLVDDDVKKEWDVTHGNTMKLAALFGDVSVGAKRQRSLENSHTVTKVVTVTRQRHDSSSDSSSDEGHERRVTKATRVTTSAKAHRQGSLSSTDSSDTNDELAKQKTTVTVVKQQSNEVGGGKRSETIVKKVAARDSGEEGKKVTVVKKVEIKDSNQEKRVSAAKKVEARDSSEERKVTGGKKGIRVEKRDSSTESDTRKQNLAIGKDRKGTKEVSVVKKTVVTQNKDSSSSSDDSDDAKRVDKKQVAAAVKAINIVEEGRKEERVKEKHKEKATTVVKKTVVTSKDTSSSDDSDEGKKVDKKQVAAAVKAINRVEEGRKEEKVNEKHKEKATTVVKKTVVTSKDTSSSDDSDEGKKVDKKQVAAAVKAINRVEEGRKEERVKEKHKEKVKTVTKKVSDSSSDSEDDEKREIVVRKELKVIKNAEIDRQSSESDSEAGKKEVTKVVKIEKKDDKRKSAVRDDSSDSEREVGKVVKEKVKKEVLEKKHAKRNLRDHSSSSSSDEETDERKDTKVVKVTKVVRVNYSNSSDDEGTTKVKKVDVKKVADERELGRRKVLVVTAHVSKDSYERALYKAAVKLFKARGDKIQTSNLYEMGFNPVASPQDFGGHVKEKRFYNYSFLAGQAKAEGRLVQDIVAEQEKVQWAELILIVSPIQNHGLPALLKGWFDRIFIYNFAYSEAQFYEKGLLRDKKVLLCLTSAGMPSMYTPYGIHGDLNVYLWPIVNGMLRFAGFDVLRPQVYFGVGHVSDDYKEKVVGALQERLRNIWIEEPLRFIPTEKFREKRGYALSGRSMAELAKTGQLTVAHYAGSHAVAMTVTVEPETSLRQDSKATSGVKFGNPWLV